MDFEQLNHEALAIKKAYTDKNQQDGHLPWSSAEYMQGFIGDVGDLAKLIMAKNNLRHIDDVDQKINHELADCLWSLLVLSSELNVNLEHEFLATMTELKQRLSIQQ